MTTSEIFGTLLCTGVPLLVGLIAIVKPLLTLNTSITQLNEAVKNLSNRLSVFELNNHDAHKRLWSKNDEQDKVIIDHASRISKLEGNA